MPVIAEPQEFGGKSAHLPENEDRTANPKTGPHIAENVLPPGASNQPLFARQDQKLRIRCEDFSDGILVLAPRLYFLTDFFYKVLRDVLNMLFAISHVGQRPLRMSLTFRAVAVGPTTAVMLQGKGAWQKIIWYLKTADEFELALTDSSSLGAFGLVFHRNVILHADIHKSQALLRMRK